MTPAPDRPDTGSNAAHGIREGDVLVKDGEEWVVVAVYDDILTVHSGDETAFWSAGYVAYAGITVIRPEA